MSPARTSPDEPIPGGTTGAAPAAPAVPTAPAVLAIAVWIPVLCDLLVVTLFVVIGRRSHDEGSALGGFFRVWWPFAAALGVSGVGSGAWWWPFRWRRVVALCVGTVALGMIGRIAIQGRDLEPSFVIVTTIFFALGMFGWRIAARRIAARRMVARRSVA